MGAPVGTSPADIKARRETLESARQKMAVVRTAQRTIRAAAITGTPLVGASEGAKRDLVQAAREVTDRAGFSIILPATPGKPLKVNIDPKKLDAIGPVSHALGVLSEKDAVDGLASLVQMQDTLLKRGSVEVAHAGPAASTLAQDKQSYQEKVRQFMDVARSAHEAGALSDEFYGDLVARLFSLRHPRHGVSAAVSPGEISDLAAKIGRRTAMGAMSILDYVARVVGVVPRSLGAVTTAITAELNKQAKGGGGLPEIAPPGVREQVVKAVKPVLDRAASDDPQESRGAVDAIRGTLAEIPSVAVDAAMGLFDPTNEDARRAWNSEALPGLVHAVAALLTTDPERRRHIDNRLGAAAALGGFALDVLVDPVTFLGTGGLADNTAKVIPKQAGEFTARFIRSSGIDAEVVVGKSGKSVKLSEMAKEGAERSLRAVLEHPEGTTAGLHKAVMKAVVDRAGRAGQMAGLAPDEVSILQQRARHFYRKALAPALGRRGLYISHPTIELKQIGGVPVPWLGAIKGRDLLPPEALRVAHYQVAQKLLKGGKWVDSLALSPDRRVRLVGKVLQRSLGPLIKAKIAGQDAVGWAFVPSYDLLKDGVDSLREDLQVTTARLESQKEALGSSELPALAKEVPDEASRREATFLVEGTSKKPLNVQRPLPPKEMDRVNRAILQARMLEDTERKIDRLEAAFRKVMGKEYQELKEMLMPEKELKTVVRDTAKQLRLQAAEPSGPARLAEAIRANGGLKPNEAEMEEFFRAVPPNLYAYRVTAGKRGGAFAPPFKVRTYFRKGELVGRGDKAVPRILKQAGIRNPDPLDLRVAAWKTIVGRLEKAKIRPGTVTEARLRTLWHDLHRLTADRKDGEAILGEARALVRALPERIRANSVLADVLDERASRELLGQVEGFRTSGKARPKTWRHWTDGDAPGLKVDQMAQVLADEHIIPDAYPATLLQALEDTPLRELDPLRTPWQEWEDDAVEMLDRAFGGEAWKISKEKAATPEGEAALWDELKATHYVEGGELLDLRRRYNKAVTAAEESLGVTYEEMRRLFKDPGSRLRSVPNPDIPPSQLAFAEKIHQEFERFHKQEIDRSLRLRGDEFGYTRSYMPIRLEKEKPEYSIGGLLGHGSPGEAHRMRFQRARDVYPSVAAAEAAGEPVITDAALLYGIRKAEHLQFMAATGVMERSLKDLGNPWVKDVVKVGREQFERLADLYPELVDIAGKGVEGSQDALDVLHYLHSRGALPAPIEKKLGAYLTVLDDNPQARFVEWKGRWLGHGPKGPLLIPESVAKAYERMEALMLGPAIPNNALWAAFQQGVVKPFLAPMYNFWKLSVTALRPGFHLRNAYSNYYQAWVGGMEDFRHVWTALILQRHGKDILFNPESKWATQLLETASGPITYKQIMEQAVEDGVLNRGWMGTDIVSRSEPYMDSLRRGRLVTWRKKLAASPREVGSAIENNARLAFYIDQRMRGVHRGLAGMEVAKWLYDYKNVTTFDKGAKVAVPFWMWTRNNFPRYLEALFTRSGKILGTVKALEGVGNVAQNQLGELDRRFVYPWLNQSMAAPLPVLTSKGMEVAEANGVLFLDPDLPLSGVNEPFDVSGLGTSRWRAGLNKEYFLNQLNPVLSGAFSFLSGKDAFKESPTGATATPGWATLNPDLNDTAGSRLARLILEANPQLAEKIGIRQSGPYIIMSKRNLYLLRELPLASQVGNLLQYGQRPVLPNVLGPLQRPVETLGSLPLRRVNVQRAARFQSQKADREIQQVLSDLFQQKLGVTEPR